jgi:hypothetical protein
VEAVQPRLICEGERALPLRPVGADGAFVSFSAVPGCCPALQEDPNGGQLVAAPLLAPLSAVSDPPPQPYKLTTAIKSAILIAYRPPNLAELLYRIRCDLFSSCAGTYTDRCFGASQIFTAVTRTNVLRRRFTAEPGQTSYVECAKMLGISSRDLA